MIDITEIQQKTADLIAEHAAFAGIVVLPDDGDITAAEEAALDADGRCAVVLPPLDGDTQNQSPGGLALIDVGIAVRLEVNPAKFPKEGDTDTALKKLLVMVKSAKAAVSAYRETNPTGNYRLDPKAFVIDDTDPGTWAVILFFRKFCTL